MIFSVSSFYDVLWVDFFFLVVGKPQYHLLLQVVESNDLTADIPGADDFSYGRKFGFEFLVDLVFKGQAAHQPSALPRYFCGVERQSLIFGHSYGYRVEFFHKRGAAEYPAAPTDTATHFGLVADAHLPHFNPRTVLFHQHFDQLPKIDPVFGSEKKGQAAGVEGGFHRKQVHFKAKLFDTAQAINLGLFFIQ